ncbi:winged helix-turn-helix transcriptional regulator [Nonomuraea jiangxiensis]|uniref:DNA-binding transcriptional regulator, HxlR family n=1 Tax=Nonomuraea jiangxiensis TaxID=633440 RepID=A0A1G9A3F9_9ACTN|nr:helix-turn-helix domain-containing protein [Nonomuraea jiangxiensis]SDK21135.1 DNA-binding transcriptional regulator, HxlR family [Nonomuraea jiangxiensis]
MTKGPRPQAPVSCPIGRAVGLLGERWTLLILRNANLGTTRFDAFRAELGIADNILSSRLARMVEAGLLTRVPYRGSGRTRHEYRLTTAGAEVLPVLHALAVWGQEHTESPEPAAPMRVIHQQCGQVTTPGRVCDHCGEPVRREEEAWVRPWLSSEPTVLASPVRTGS